jgi:hypothetical protein
MAVIHVDRQSVAGARRALAALDRGEPLSVGAAALPAGVDDMLRPVLELLADAKPVWYSAREFVADEERPKCVECGEPVELADPDDGESWIHAEDASYFGDHSASVV